MIYIDKEGKYRCDNCCISCEENKKTCEARSERGRRINRLTYQAKKKFRENRINFIIDNYPEFDEETPQEWKDDLRKKLKNMSDKDLQGEYEWVDYLLDK